jgi:hypothetical protein
MISANWRKSLVAYSMILDESLVEQLEPLTCYDNEYILQN